MRHPISSPARSLAASGPMGKPNSTIAASMSFGPGAFQHQPLGCGVPLAKHAVPDKAVRIAHNDRHLAHAPGDRDERQNGSLGRLPARGRSRPSASQFAGLKKCIPATAAGRDVAAAIASTSR
jgi:hypothetical protein